jgi:diaminopimelate decarboxylase
MPDLSIGQTPAYVYDLDEVRRAHALLRSALPQPSTLFYSLKANPHPAIVTTLREAGCGAEVCSPGELAAALRAGVAPARILYTGPGKRDEDVGNAIMSGVVLFSVDSPVGMDQLGRIALGLGRRVRCLLRLNGSRPAPGQGLAMTGVTSQFGADVDWVKAEPGRFLSRPGAGLAGFHLFMGTGLSGERELINQFEMSVATARDLSDVMAVEPEMLDLGGGFGAPFARPGELPRLPGLAMRLSEILDAAFPGWRHGCPEVTFESGRYLTSTSGTLFTRVLDLKHSHGRPVIVLESGIHHLGGNSGLRRLPPVAPELDSPELDGEAREGELDGAMVAGPLCTPLDTWATNATLPALRPGDLIRVPNVGAYGLSASLLAFLSHPAPREVVVEAGRVIEVSRLNLVRRTEHRTMKDSPWTHTS